MVRLVLFLAFVATVLAANWAVAAFGLVPIGFGLVAPAATFFVGAALSLRDGIHETGGVPLALAAIVVGAALSAVVAGPTLAVASGAAFLVSELLDFAVYAPIRRRAWLLAVVVSNLVGAVVDTWVFLNLAGFPITGKSFAAQLVAKVVYVTPVALLLVWAARRAVARWGRCSTSAARNRPGCAD